jgi:hypothetical protein
MKVDELRFICDNVTKLGFIGNIRSWCNFWRDWIITQGNIWSGSQRSSNGSIGGGGRYDDLTGILVWKHEWCWNFVRPHLLGGGRNLFRKRSPNHQKRCLLITAIPKRFTPCRQYKSYEVWYKSRIVSR